MSTSILKVGRGHIPRKDGRETAVDYVGANVLFVNIGFVTHALSLSEIAFLPTKPQKVLKREMTTGTQCSTIIQ